MVHVVAESYVAKENWEKYLEVCKELVECTRAEKGCIQYVLTKGLNNEDAFVFVEKWESMEDLENHLKSAHVTTIGPKLKEYRYESRDVLKLEEVI